MNGEAPCRLPSAARAAPRPGGRGAARRSPRKLGAGGRVRSAGRSRVSGAPARRPRVSNDGFPAPEPGSRTLTTSSRVASGSWRHKPQPPVGQQGDVAFGAFQAGMAAAGWLLGSSAGQWVAQWDHWIAFALLLLVGGKMLIQALRPRHDDEEPGSSRLGFRTIVVREAVGDRLPEPHEANLLDIDSKIGCPCS